MPSKHWNAYLVPGSSLFSGSQSNVCLLLGLALRTNSSLQQKAALLA